MSRPMPVYTEALVTPEPWMQEAHCAQVDPEMFFPAPGDQAWEARAVCAGCPVQTDCLAYALRTGQGDGIWGGLTPGERRGRRQRDCWECGVDITSRPPQAKRCEPCSNRRRGKAAA